MSLSSYRDWLIYSNLNVTIQGSLTLVSIFYLLNYSMLLKLLSSPVSWSIMEFMLSDFLIDPKPLS